MPIVAECILCHQKVRVPDRARGASVQCPRCGSYFTAAGDDVPFSTAKTGTGSSTAPLPPVPIPTAAGPADAMAASTMGTHALPQVQDVEQRTSPAPFDPPVKSEFKRPKIDPVGVAALLLGAMALVSASFAWQFNWLTLLVLPLAILGTLVGLAGVAVGLRRPRPRYRLASVAAVVDLMIVVVGVFAPSLLGPTYALSRGRAAPEPATLRAVPLPGRAAPGEKIDPDWVDATRFALQFKNVRVQVVAAAVRPLEIATQPKRKFTREDYLVIRVRAHQPGGTADFATGQRGAPGKPTERPAATLTDPAGKVYPPPTGDMGGEAAELTQKSDLFPLGITDEIYLFTAPPVGIESLRLEIPAATWGGEGVLRFRLPATMIRREPRKE